MPDSTTVKDSADTVNSPGGDYYYDDAFGYEPFVDNDDEETAIPEDEACDEPAFDEKTVANGGLKA